VRDGMKKKTCCGASYSLRPILLFANIDVSRYILVVDISVFAKSIMGRREYFLVHRQGHATHGGGGGTSTFYPRGIQSVFSFSELG
jgi:hypothetical protein